MARATVGALLVGSVLYGHAARGWHPVAWLVGLLVFPALETRRAGPGVGPGVGHGVGHGR